MKPTPKKTHGGARPGAGRKKLGRKPRLIRMSDASWSLFKADAKSKGVTPGELLERVYPPKDS